MGAFQGQRQRRCLGCDQHPATMAEARAGVTIDVDGNTIRVGMNPDLVKNHVPSY